MTPTQFACVVLLAFTLIGLYRLADKGRGIQLKFRFLYGLLDLEAKVTEDKRPDRRNK